MSDLDSYIVCEHADVKKLKRKDQASLKLLLNKVEQIRHFDGKSDMDCLVLTSTDPDYSLVSGSRKIRIQNQKVE